MKKIDVLDCTLRDGGYCNQWKFGRENIDKIVLALLEANVDIIECGFVSDRVEAEAGVTKFCSMEAVTSVIPEDRKGKKFVCMINYGEMPLEKIPYYHGKLVDGIRIAFHKNQMDNALAYCQKLVEKGYTVFLQPMVSLNYSDREFLELIEKVNQLDIYAFYIVDSFGGMKEKELARLFYLVEHNLREDIVIGFHSHNNMQMAFPNAKFLTSINTKRDLILDSSIFGMGRGAGNLNTELLLEHLNELESDKYQLQPILSVIDRVLNKFYQENNWGYSIPNYLSAKNNVHPNYASYLVDKQTLPIEDMYQIFAMMSPDKKGSFDKLYIDELYYHYMERGKCYEEHLDEFIENIKKKKVLLIAPGKSVEEEKKKVIRFAKATDTLVLCINFQYEYVESDYVFVSNLRRYQELDKHIRRKCILTSNIPEDNCYMKIKYESLLNGVEEVRDNAGLMLIQFLIQIGIKEIYIAGMDGYSYDTKNNYAKESMALVSKRVISDGRNRGMEYMLKCYSEQIKIHFITQNRFGDI